MVQYRGRDQVHSVVAVPARAIVKVGSDAPKGRNSIAQGITLGRRLPEVIEALKGRDSFRHIRSFALSGLGHICVSSPRALPWAIDGLPLRGGSRPPHLASIKLRQRRRIRSYTLFLLLIASLAAAQDSAQLDPIVVTASRSRQSLRDVPASVSIVDQQDVQEARPTLGIDEALNRVPGVFAQSSANFAQDVRLQIRGFGARAEFGVREVKVLVDGLPETLADGQTELDGVDMGAIGRIEVLRGPASSLYGNASGGVIQLFTEEPPDRPRTEARATWGSFGYGKYQVKGGGKVGGLGAFVHASHLELQGYRDHSSGRATTATAKLRYDVDADTSVTLLLNAVDAPKGDDPGGLKRDEADTSPRMASPRNVQFDAGEEVQQGRIGAVAVHVFAASELAAYAYALYRDFSNRLPIGPPTAAAQGGAVAFHRFAPGAGLRYVAGGRLLGLQHTFSAGLDAQHQDDDRRRYSNLNGQRGELGLVQHEEVSSIGPYLREAVQLTDRIELNLGLRYDAVRLAVDVDLPASSDAGGSRTLSAWSPSGGLLYRARPDTSVFLNVGSAFQVPTTTELANPAGAGFNPDVDPQQALSTEVGARVEGQGWSGGLSGFFIDVDDVLVRYETAEQPGRSFFRNAAHARRFGVEIESQVLLLPELRWSSALTAMQTQFSEGPAEPGVPPWQVYQELRYEHRSGLFGAVEAFAVDGYAVESSGRARARGYELCNLRSGYRWKSGPWSLEPFVGIANVTDTNYDARVRINDANLRFFEPGPGRSAYGGLVINAAL